MNNRIIGLNKLLREKILLNAVTSTGASSAETVSMFNKMTFYITSSSVSSGGTVLIQGSADGTNWVTLDTTNVTSSGTDAVSFSEILHKFVRVNLSARTDGTYTVKFIAGE